MKTLFTVFLLACGASVFAHNGDNTSPTPSENNTSVTMARETKATKQTKAIRTTESQEKVIPTRKTSRICNNDHDAPGYGISSYFVEFVHKSNMKLVKLLAD